MIRSILFIIAILAFISAKAFAQGPGNLNAGSQLSVTGSTGAYTFSWWGVTGNTYLIETSDDLVNWSYLPIVESGSNAVIQWGFTSTSASLFMKLEYISVPAGQLTGQAFNGPDNDADGLPDDWELFYFGHTGVNPTAYVPWSGGTVTNLQAYQQGLNPTDFYNGTLPSLTAITGTALPAESGSSTMISVQVTGSSNNPIPGAPVIFSIDYGLLSRPGGNSMSQEVEVAADSNGYASVTVLEPLWPGVTYTVTAKAETGGQIVSIPFSGETGEDDPTKPSIPAPAIPNPNNVPEPTLSVAMSGTSVANPAFEQYMPPTSGPVSWYLTWTESFNQIFPNTAEYPFTSQVSGTSSLSETVTPLFGGISYSGHSDQIWTQTFYGSVITDVESEADEDQYGNWSGTYSSTYNVHPPPNENYSIAYNPLPLPSDALVAVSPTEALVSGSWASLPWNFSGGAQLSNQYTDQQFTTDVINTLASAPTVDSTNYALGSPIASWNLAADSSSFSIETGTYTFNCSTSGSNPYVFEWYEVFQPADNTQPIQVTRKEWDYANEQTQSPAFAINPAASGTNGTWYISRLDMTTQAQYPECRWRHVIGVGEPVTFNLLGLPSFVSGSATWSITPSTSGSFKSISLTGPEKLFIAARTPGNVTITATLPGGSTMSTTLTIIAPTGVTYTKIAAISMPWWGVGAGMWGQYTILPTNVSFSGCVFQEEKCPSTDPSGFYYITNLTIWHNPNGVSGILEPPDTNPEWISIQDDNTAGDLDRAEAGPANFISAEAFDGLSGEGSGFTWEIPLRYKCQNDTDNGVALPSPVTTNMQISVHYGSFVEKINAAEYNGQ